MNYHLSFMNCRHPNYLGSVIKQFGNHLKNIVNMISKQNAKFYLFGNYNIDLLKTYKNNLTHEYVNNLLPSSVTCGINKPTRITSSTDTLIDHIYFNDVDLSLLSDINIIDLSTYNGFFFNIPVRV